MFNKPCSARMQSIFLSILIGLCIFVMLSGVVVASVSIVSNPIYEVVHYSAAWLFMALVCYRLAWYFIGLRRRFLLVFG